MRERRVANGRAQVGKQPQRLAQAQDGLLGPQMALQLVVSGVAHGAKEHGVSLLREPERGFGQRVAAGGVGRAAHGSFLHFKGQGQGFENFDSLGHDFGANAVARQKGDFHGALSLFRSGGKGKESYLLPIS